MNKSEYTQARRRARYQRSIVSVISFAVVLIFFCIFGLLLPLRPKESAAENRMLKEFPKFSLSAVMDGSYFSDISEWYSDTFPLRDGWMKQSDRITGLYGIRTNRIIQGNASKDEIPDLPGRVPEEEEDPALSAADLTEKETESASLPEETIAPSAGTEEPVSEPAPGESSAFASNTNGETETKAGQEQTTMAPITAQAQNGMFVNGDSAFGIYYFNLESANTYINTVNRMAQNLAGQTNVYCMLVPISSSFYLSQESLDATDGSDEKAAMDYYYGSMDESVKKIEIYDVLDAHKDEYIYFRTDHHWNGRGAYYAYRTWAEAKGVTPHELSEYEERDYGGFLGSYYASSKSAAMESNPDTVEAFVPLTCDTLTMTQRDGSVLNWPIINDVSGYSATQKYSCFSGADEPYSVINNPNVSNGESCVVIKESYANALIPFLADHYQTVYWFDYRYYNGDITSFIREHGVTDLIFVNGTEPITSVASMQRMSGLLP